jgi:hypothetical protein
VKQGLRLQTDVDAFPAEAALSTDSDAIFFLVRSPSVSDSYDLAGGPFGVFRVSDEKVFSLTSEVASRRGEQVMSLVDFLGALEEARAR